MKKPGIDTQLPIPSILKALKENIEIFSGRVGGAIALTKGVPSPSVGIDVAAGTGTNVATTVELNQLIARVGDIERTLNTLIARMNTP